jgi:hypothetical protein
MRVFGSTSSHSPTFQRLEEDRVDSETDKDAAVFLPGIGRLGAMGVHGL